MDRDWLSGENRYLEYKAQLSRTLLKSVSAFANYHDGRIVIGIRDDCSVAGMPDVASARLALEHMIHDSLVPQPFYEIETFVYEGEDLIFLTVYQGENTPYTVSNKAYKRSDTSTVPVDRFEYHELVLRGRNLSYEELPFEQADLTFHRLEALLRERLRLGTVNQDVLRSLELMNREQYNLAAALLSDQNPVRHAGISLVRFEGIHVSQIKDVQRLEHVSLLTQYDSCMDFYRKHLSQGERITGPYHEKTEEVPFVAYREAVANALLHRDYSRPVENRVEIYDDRVEVVSPGGLPPGVATEEYLAGKVSIPRNRILADIFLRLGIIERLATGVRRIRQYYAGQSEQPTFEVGENSILVILPRLAQKEAGFPNEKNRSVRSVTIDQPGNALTGQEMQVLHLFEQKQEIKRRDVEAALKLGKTQAYGVLDQLVKVGLLVRKGSARSTTYQIRGK